MFQMSRFKGCGNAKNDPPTPKEEVDRSEEISANSSEITFNVGTLPCEMDVYQRTEASFLPEGKTLEDLTEEETAQLKRQYRFAYYRPGQYQSITGFGCML